jgi:hypothetical protein
VCPYYLDGDLAQNFQERPFAKTFPVVEGPVIPVIGRRLSKAADCGFYAVFKDRGEA